MRLSRGSPQIDELGRCDDGTARTGFVQQQAISGHQDRVRGAGQQRPKVGIARVSSFVSRVVRGFPPYRVGDDFGQQNVDLCFI